MRFLFATIVLCAGSLATCALSQIYPTKMVRMVIGFPPGGGTDISGRIVAQPLSQVLRQQIIVDNRDGASGQVAAELVSTYDPERAFAPISLIASSPNLVVVHPSLPVKNIKELIALAALRPGQLQFASVGHGSVQHLAGELFNLQAKVQLNHVPYKGGGPAIVDLVAGHVHTCFDVIPVALPHVKSGRLRMIAVTGNQRTAVLPDLPTISESGLPGLDLAT